MAGGVLGAAISSVWQSGERRALSAATSAPTRRRTRRSASGDLAQLAVERFVEAGSSALYASQLVAPGTALPYLIDDEVDVARLTAEDEACFQLSGEEREFEVSKRALRWFELRGARLFDGEILFVEQRSIAEGG